MTTRINNQLVCDGNYNSVHYTFAQMIERASENNVMLHPGDILGSGTVGWGSLIENNLKYTVPWNLATWWNWKSKVSGC
jgi:2-keto-4-pentenoate hydratase/2-oxohepta-3-ene-1,7-dioic acid hydratase in catechol pathway